MSPDTRRSGRELSSPTQASQICDCPGPRGPARNESAPGPLPRSTLSYPGFQSMDLGAFRSSLRGQKLSLQVKPLLPLQQNENAVTDSL